MDPEPVSSQQVQSPAPEQPTKSQPVEEPQVGNQETQVQPQPNPSEQAAQEPPKAPEEPEENKLPLTHQQLLAAFEKFDADKDGKITVEETVKLLEENGMSVYEGHVSWVTTKIHPEEYKKDAHKYFTFEQFEAFYYRQRNEIKKQIWESSMNVVSEIESWRKKFFKIDSDEQPEGEEKVAPKIQQPPKPEKQSEKQFQGDVEILVGDEGQSYNCNVEGRVIKSSKQNRKPYIKLILHQKSQQKAKQFDERIRNLYKFLVELAISKEPDYEEMIKEIQFDTSVDDNRVNISLTTSSPELIQLIQIGASFIDQIFGTKMEANAQFKAQFNMDVKKFLEKTQCYTFHECLMRNFKARLIWNVLNFKQSVRELYRKAVDYFEQEDIRKSYYSGGYYGYGYKQPTVPFNPIFLILFLFLNSRNCQTKLTLNNIEPPEKPDEEMKKYLIKSLMEIKRKLERREVGRLFEEAMRTFDNKIQFEVGVCDWYAEGKAEVEDLNLLINFEKLNILNSQN